MDLLGNDPLSYEGQLSNAPMLDIFQSYDIHREAQRRLASRVPLLTQTQRNPTAANEILSNFLNSGVSRQQNEVRNVSELYKGFFVIFFSKGKITFNSSSIYSVGIRGSEYHSLPKHSNSVFDDNTYFFPIYGVKDYHVHLSSEGHHPSEEHLQLNNALVNYILHYNYDFQIRGNNFNPNIQFAQNNENLGIISNTSIIPFFSYIVSQMYSTHRNITTQKMESIFGYDFIHNLETGVNSQVISYAAVYLSRNLSRNYDAIRNQYVPRYVNRPLYLSKSSYTYSDLLHSTFIEGNNLFDLFENSDIKDIKNSFGEDGCVPFVYDSRLSEDEISDIPIVNESNAMEIEKINDAKERLSLMKGKTISQISKDLEMLKRKYNIVDKENNIILSSPGVGRQSRKPAINFIVSNEHCFLIKKSTRDSSFGESSLNREIVNPSESDYLNSRIKKLKFTRDIYFDGSFEEIEDKIRDSILLQQEKKIYLVSNSHFERIYFNFNSRNKEPKIQYDKNKIPTVMKFIFEKTKKGDSNKRNFDIKRCDFSSELYEKKNRLLEIFHNKNTRSCFNEISYNYITKNKNNILFGVFTPTEEDCVGFDRNKAYPFSLEEVLREMRGVGIPKICYQDYPVFLNDDSVIKYSRSNEFSFKLDDLTIYFVRFTFTNGLLPIHDGCYYGVYLRKLISINEKTKIFESFEIDSYLKTPFTIDRNTHEDMLNEISSIRTKCENPNSTVGEVKEIKKIVNELIGLFEKYKLEITNSYTDEDFDTVKEISDGTQFHISTHQIQGKNFYSTSLSKKEIPISSNLLPLSMMIKQNNMIKIIEKSSFVYNRFGFIPIGIRTDSILYSLSQYEKIRFPFIGIEWGDYKIENKGKIVNQMFRRVNAYRNSNVVRIHSNDIIQVSSLEDFETLKPKIVNIGKVILIGNAGSGKTYYFEGDTVSFPKNKTLVLTFEGSPSEKWIKKGYHSLTYHKAFRLAVGDSDETNGKTDLSEIENVVFEEFGKMSKNQQFEIKLKYEKMIEKYKNIKRLVVTTGLTQIISPDDDSFLSRSEYPSFVSVGERYISTLFNDSESIIISLNYNMREKTIEDSEKRNEIQKYLFSKSENYISTIKDNFKFVELDSIDDLNVNDDEIYIFDTNELIIKIFSEKSSPGRVFYLKKEINQNKMKLRIGTMVKLLTEEDHKVEFEVLSGKYTSSKFTLEGNVFGEDKDGKKYALMYPHNLMTGNIAQGETYDKNVNIVIQLPMTFYNPFWIYQAITRCTSNEKITFYYHPYRY